MDALGFNYYAMMFYPGDNDDQGQSQIGVIATESNTVVRVVFREDMGVQVNFGGQTYGQGNNELTVTLNQYQAFVIQDLGLADLSGTFQLLTFSVRCNYKLDISSS